MQIDLHVSTTDGDNDATIQRISQALAVLAGKSVGVANVTVVNGAPTPPSPTEGRDTGNLTSAGTEPTEPEATPDPEPEPEKPKRTRRTKAQIAADKAKAEAEAAAAAEADADDAAKAAAGDPDEADDSGADIDFGSADEPEETEADEVEAADADDDDEAPADDDELTLEKLVDLGKAYLEGRHNGGKEGDPAKIREILDDHGYARLSKVPPSGFSAIAEALRELAKS